MTRIDAGRKAPDFTLNDQFGNPFTLKDHGDQAVVLFFYPKDCTSGCTLEATDFSAMTERFADAGAVVVGVSILGEKSKKKFADQAGLEIRLLADDRLNDDKKPDPKVCAKYGVWVEKSMYGRTYMGIERATYLIKPNRTVAERWDKVKVTGHAESVLDAVSALGLDPISPAVPGAGE